MTIDRERIAEKTDELEQLKSVKQTEQFWGEKVNNDYYINYEVYPTKSTENVVRDIRSSDNLTAQSILERDGYITVTLII